MKTRKIIILVLLTLGVLSALCYSACSNNKNKTPPIIPDLTEKLQQEYNKGLNGKPEFKFVTPKPKLSPRFPKKKRKNLVIFSCNLLKI